MKKVKLHHSKRGVLYAKPSDILRTENAKSQINALKRYIKNENSKFNGPALNGRGD